MYPKMVAIKTIACSAKKMPKYKIKMLFGLGMQQYISPNPPQKKTKNKQTKTVFIV